MRRILTLVIALLFATVAAAPAYADTTVLAKNDKRGDVKLYKSKYLSKAKKKSIDIQRASIIQRSNGSMRFKVRIKKIKKSKKWDQMVFFSTSLPSDDSQFVDIGFTIRRSKGAYAHNSTRGETCSLKVKRKGRTAWVDVPQRCTPSTGHRVLLTTYTGHFQTDAPPYSRDKLRLGTVKLG